jgi:hypothetical protein
LAHESAVNVEGGVKPKDGVKPLLTKAQRSDDVAGVLADELVGLHEPLPHRNPPGATVRELGSLSRDGDPIGERTPASDTRPSRVVDKRKDRAQGRSYFLHTRIAGKVKIYCFTLLRKTVKDQ